MIQPPIPRSTQFNVPTAPAPRPARNQPGTIAEQFLAIARSFQLADEEQTSAAEQWERARADVQRRALP
ncbi:hypothetical protein FYK55_00930 [Roseiconus nitratireducens]|uniref:Uncharacterized protein n=1 Tax=Roseiconus nitratireducens TaxID=2605748 RepID=A0A5M6DHJ5_9BACT|nr:hypothetical protein [Roseiconus nitratireducens]KAA5547014.1 hypothetical protein FYK55_00930 [Roseiconus nitratireducens]